MIKHLLILVLTLILIASCSETIEVERFDLNSLSKEWIHLTETDSGFVVYNSCDHGNMLISINGDSQLVFHGQQEDYGFDVISAERFINDTIEIVSKWSGSEDMQTFKMFVQQNPERLLRVATNNPNVFSMDYVFVDEANVHKYDVYNQPCKECWPEEECEETITESVVQVDSFIAVNFINEYIEFLNGKGDTLGRMDWIRANSKLSKRFKSTYVELIEEAYLEDPEYGLGYDPIINGQDYPEKGFKLFSIELDSGYVSLTGIGWEEVKLTMRVFQEEGVWVVDGSGSINIPYQRQAKN